MVQFASILASFVVTSSKLVGHPSPERSFFATGSFSSTSCCDDNFRRVTAEKTSQGLVLSAVTAWPSPAAASSSAVQPKVTANGAKIKTMMGNVAHVGSEVFI